MPNENYEAYEYLPQGARVDHDLAETQTGEPYEVPLTEAEERRYEATIEDQLVISLHDHPVRITSDIGLPYERYTQDAWQKINHEALAASPLDAMFAHPVAVRTWDEAIESLGKLMTDTDKAPGLQQCRTVEGLHEVRDMDRFGFVFGLETTSMVEDELDRLDVLYGLGVRTINIVYTRSNMAATGYAERRDGGLTKLGEEMIRRMNDLGILVDLSHGSEQTILDACEVSNDPVLLSHNGARALLDIDRLNSDESLKAVADTGGLVGIQAGPYNTVSREHPRHSIESFMDHFEYVKELVGIDHVTFGPDTLYGDHVALQEYFGLRLSEFPDFVEEIEYVHGMDNPTESWRNIVRWLISEGFSHENLEKLLGGNTLRVVDQVWS